MKSRPLLWSLIVWSTVIFLFTGCDNGGGAETGSGKPKIVCTTGMIGDMVKNIVGDAAEVQSLMGPGVDPHLYKAKQSDLIAMDEADIVVYNGLHLEGKMGEMLENFGKQKPVIALASGLSPARIRKTAAFQGSVDPHIWFDVALWAEAFAFCADTLGQLIPDHASEISGAKAAYSDSLRALHQWTAAEIAAIPPEQRVLITAHDAFGYFGEAYGIEVRGLQGISTLSEFGLQDITNLVNFIVDKRIKAVFVETSVSQKSINSVVEGCRKKGHDVQVGGALFSDAMGAAGTPEGSYLGMVRANVRTITEALK